MLYFQLIKLEEHWYLDTPHTPFQGQILWHTGINIILHLNTFAFDQKINLFKNYIKIN